MTYKDACLYVGIVESTYYNWMSRAEKAKSGIYKEFLESVQEARNKAKNALVTTMHKCAAGGIKTVEYKRKVNPQTGAVVEEEQIHKTTLPDPRTALAILARRYPDEWAELTKHDIKGQIAMPPIIMGMSNEAMEIQKNVVVEDDKGH